MFRFLNTVYLFFSYDSGARPPFIGGPRRLPSLPLPMPAVDLGLIPSRVKPMTLKLVFTASWLDAQH